MIKRLFKYLVLVVLIVASVSMEAMSQNVTGSGMSTIKSNTKTKQFFKSTVCLNDDPGTSTVVYNDADESTDVAGSVNVTRYDEEITVEWHVPTLGSTGIDITMLGRFGTDTGWALLDTESITAVTGTSTHGTITIQEKPMWFKVGRQATGVDGVDDISIWIRGSGWAE